MNFPDIASGEFNTYNPYDIFEKIYSNMCSSPHGITAGNSSVENVIMKSVLKLAAPGTTLGVKIPGYIATLVSKSNNRLSNIFLRELIKFYSENATCNIRDGVFDIFVFECISAFQTCEWKHVANKYNIVPLVKDLFIGFKNRILNGSPGDPIICGDNYLHNLDSVNSIFFSHVVLSLNVFLVHMQHYKNIDIEEYYTWLKSINLPAYVHEYISEYGTYNEFLRSYILPKEFSFHEGFSVISMYTHPNEFSKYYKNKYAGLESISRYTEKLNNIQFMFEEHK